MGLRECESWQYNGGFDGEGCSWSGEETEGLLIPDDSGEFDYLLFVCPTCAQSPDLEIWKQRAKYGEGC